MDYGRLTTQRTVVIDVTELDSWQRKVLNEIIKKGLYAGMARQTGPLGENVEIAIKAPQGTMSATFNRFDGYYWVNSGDFRMQNNSVEALVYNIQAGLRQLNSFWLAAVR